MVKTPSSKETQEKQKQQQQQQQQKPSNIIMFRIVHNNLCMENKRVGSFEGHFSE